uniref:Uncharacterized protein n=1 Tax=Romanomermis culicivorax TaxID=13658 RepID=A0A915KRA8_ROMCU
MCVGYPNIQTDILKNGYPDIFTVQKRIISTVLKKPATYRLLMKVLRLRRERSSSSLSSLLIKVSSRQRLLGGMSLKSISSTEKTLHSRFAIATPLLFRFLT